MIQYGWNRDFLKDESKRIYLEGAQETNRETDKSCKGVYMLSLVQQKIQERFTCYTRDLICVLFPESRNPGLRGRME